MEHRTKVIVPNIPDGRGDVIPTGVILPDGRCLPVEKFPGCEKGACMKIGVAGKRYRCLISHGSGDYRQQSLWREGDEWFVREVVDDEMC